VGFRLKKGKTRLILVQQLSLYLQQAVYLFLGVEEVARYSYPAYASRVPVGDDYVVLLELVVDHLVLLEAPGVVRHQRSAFTGFLRGVDLHRMLPQPVYEALAEHGCSLLDVLCPELVEVAEACVEAPRILLADASSVVFTCVGVERPAVGLDVVVAGLLPGGAVPERLLHVAVVHVRGLEHVVEALLHVEDAGHGRAAEPLLAAEGEEVDVFGLYVDVHGSRRLVGVVDDVGAVAVGDLGYLPHGVPDAAGPLDLAHAHRARLVVYRLLEVACVDDSVPVPYPSDLDSLEPVGHPDVDVGLVAQVGDDDVLSLLGLHHGRHGVEALAYSVDPAYLLGGDVEELGGLRGCVRGLDLLLVDPVSPPLLGGVMYALQRGAVGRAVHVGLGVEDRELGSHFLYVVAYIHGESSSGILLRLDRNG